MTGARVFPRDRSSSVLPETGVREFFPRQELECFFRRVQTELNSQNKPNSCEAIACYKTKQNKSHKTRSKPRTNSVPVTNKYEP